MSYLEMSGAALPNMSKGIISLWFRDAAKGEAPPPDEWPSGAWTEGTDSMVPPDTQAIVQTMSPSSVFYWNAYGVHAQGLVPLPFNAPAPMFIPTPPPFATDTVRMFLTFGRADQTYNYCPWHLDFPDVIAAVQYADFAGFIHDTWPPPYAPYYKSLGDSDGLFRVANMKIGAPAPKPKMVPQSFIGVDKDGYLVICLQTGTSAQYEGYAFMLDKVTELSAGATQLIIDGPPFHYSQIGFPFPDGHWIQTAGYWNGYQFEYRDISNEVMGAQGETFVIGGPGGGPKADGGTWHHLLFSFDISGSVTSIQPDPAVPGAPPVPSVTTNCKAWLAVDDHNYTGADLQRRRVLPDGVTSPLLPGMPPGFFGIGPVTSYARTDFPGLGPNDILPQNVWIHYTFGSPRSGLLRYAANSGVLDTGNAWASAGDFNPFYWAAGIWPLYGHGVAPGPWLPVLDPPRPTVPDPKTDFAVPTYRCSSFSIPTNGSPVGVPVSGRHVDHNTGVEMAELQIWSNKTLDTSLLEARRLFIDSHGKPVPPKVTAAALGKPDILLHGSGNWKKGVNTGLAGGQFKRVATIEKFTPDPQLRT